MEFPHSSAFNPRKFIKTPTNPDFIHGASRIVFGRDLPGCNSGLAREKSPQRPMKAFGTILIAAALAGRPARADEPGNGSWALPANVV